ncbi:MAG: hypothetical protein CMA91_03295, partial [Euryarchaeota archaeon]|nr:hypothetical protein [Euryarchaeota archaeon]
MKINGLSVKYSPKHQDDMEKLDNRLEKSRVIMEPNDNTMETIDLQELREQINCLLTANAPRLWPKPKARLTPIERAAGFTNENRRGANDFCNTFGLEVLEEFWSLG